ncbi:copper resistance protein CopC [Microbacterium sp. LS_15]|uniref:copper resistance CopC family protein n=1 Tax=Microbacterium sp. LS_15 TaxID=3055790 RepID=UPI0035BF45BC
MSPFRRYAAGLMLGAVAVVATAVPASAHDQLISSTPGAGEQLAVAPTAISMTFSGELLVLDESTTGAVVLVVDGEGTEWATGAVTVSGSTVTAELKPDLPVAGYQVRWQVVSEDGHPISGVIPFTVGDAEPLAAASSTSGGATPAAAPAREPDQIADETSGVLRVLLVGGIGAAVAVALLVVIRLLRRPRTAAAAPDTGDSATEI